MKSFFTGPISSKQLQPINRAQDARAEKRGRPTQEPGRAPLAECENILQHFSKIVLSALKKSEYIFPFSNSGEI